MGCNAERKVILGVSQHPACQCAVRGDVSDQMFADDLVVRQADGGYDTPQPGLVFCVCKRSDGFDVVGRVEIDIILREIFESIVHVGFAPRSYDRIVNGAIVPDIQPLVGGN